MPAEVEHQGAGAVVDADVVIGRTAEEPPVRGDGSVCIAGCAGLWLRWVGISAASLALGEAAFGLIDDTVGEMGNVGDPIAHLGGGLPLVAGIFGFGQWLRLRRFAGGAGSWVVGAAVV